ncbi:hypothetical protein SAMN05428984_1283 [Sphingomonas sp. OK281]|nr:hypothetical protein SAMN05428984_1283 [Sphingomonas sp. OK281]
MKAALRDYDLTNWTPAFAGVAGLEGDGLRKDRLGTGNHKGQDRLVPSWNFQRDGLEVGSRGGIRRGRAPDSASGLHGS